MPLFPGGIVHDTPQSSRKTQKAGEQPPASLLERKARISTFPSRIPARQERAGG